MAYKPKKVKEWEAKVAERGCIITGRSDIQIHHVVGRKARFNKQRIGQWYILPLCLKYHITGGDDPLNVTYWPNQFEQEFGTQCVLFVGMCQRFEDEGYTLPFGYDVLDAIQQWRR